MDEARRTAKGWNDPPSMEEMVKNRSSTSTNHISTIKKYRSYRSDVTNPAPAPVQYQQYEQPGSNVYLGAPNATSAGTHNYQS